MEDGLLGDVLDSSVSGKLNYVAPDKGTYAEGDDVVLKFTADSSNDYLSKITGLYLNGDWRYLGEITTPSIPKTTPLPSKAICCTSAKTQ